MDVEPGFYDPEIVSLSPEGNNYKDYVNIFPGPNFVASGWRCPLVRGVSKERFHCIAKTLVSSCSYFKNGYLISIIIITKKDVFP